MKRTRRRSSKDGCRLRRRCALEYLRARASGGRRRPSVRRSHPSWRRGPRTGGGARRLARHGDPGLLLRGTRVWPAAPGVRAGDDEVNRAYADGPFTVSRGEEVVVPFAVRQPWATPFTEMAGRALGVVLELRTRVDDTAPRTGSDEALLHVSPLPLHEAVLEPFSGHGYTCEAGRLTRSGSRTSTSPTTSTRCSNCGTV
ncbi:MULTISPECIES: sporulation protein [unclassified Streptomyces]|uniref:sporulation protein n=1 Tax=unclassified Streptomyces TaxID=2593676 RepID=UPI000B855555